MFGELVVAYLFLAGTGAGGTAVAALADLVFVREPFGLHAARAFDEKRPAERLVALVFAASALALALGAACLALDLGRLDRVLALFASPAPTLMTIGAWSLALLAGATAALTLVRFLYLPAWRRLWVAALEVVAVVLAAVVAGYAGLLLQTLVGVRLWTLPWVPVLFVLSAASCGCALPLAAMLFVEDDGALALLARALVRIDAGIIVAEAVAAALFLTAVLGSEHPGMQQSALSLLEGSAALPWWVGFVLCGVLLPLAAEVAWVWRQRASATSWQLPVAVTTFALTGALVLAGGIGLRAAVVEAGAQRPLALQDSGEAVSLSQEGPSDEREDISSWLS